MLNIHPDLVTPNELVSGSYSEVAVWDLENGQPQRYLTGHRNWVLDADWSEDGGLITVAIDWSVDGRLASAGSYAKIIIWDVETKLPAKTFLGHTNSINSIDWSPDGQLVSGADDNQVIIWDLDNETPGIILREFPEDVHEVAWPQMEPIS